MGASVKRGTFRSAWRHRRWRYLLVGFAVSSAGDFLYAVALTVFLLESTGSAGWLAAAAIGRIVPYVVLGPIGGVIADRYDRRLVMIVFDLARAACMGAIAILVAVEGPAGAVVAIAIVAAAASTPYRPAAGAATPVLVREDDLAAANAIEGVVSQACWFLGPAFGAVLLALTSPAWSFVANATAFVVSALFVSRIGRVGGGRGGASTEDDSLRAGVLSDLGEGWRVTRSTAGVLA